MQFRPYVSSSTLDDFDEKASLTARRRWWERFLNLTIQGGWSDEMKVYELKLKMPPAVRNWRGQLAPKDRRDWKRLSRLFRREYVKSRMSEPERYYTMSQYRDETALAFLYRLNLASERTDLNFRKSSADRERHIKRFIKKLSDDQLKRTLESQRFRRVSDLEFVLKQQEEVRQKDGPPARQSRDFKADNVVRDHYKPRREDRAYVAQGDEDSGYDEVDERETSVRSAPAVNNPSVSSNSSTPNDSTSEICTPNYTLTREDLIHEVYRVMDRVGWPQRPQAQRPGGPSQGQPQRPQHPGFQSRYNPDRDETCADCGRLGHRSENCWGNLICGRCHRHGHPTRLCETRPCRKCGEFHEGRCEDWKAFQEIKKLVRQGGLTDLPSDVRDAILDAEADSEGAQLN
ncbi:hypothetical protein AM587_10003285 [Phytophthora nicotianae]|uniref:CCHC-type domain-containing protein n=1 Tax=Phytophthora nicotianae TaxID=4792 RepID=A0A0W8CEF3_PHYNI|nr:hypothetical protein AM587_10003285 [Phytophthora nicotianae]